MQLTPEILKTLEQLLVDAREMRSKCEDPDHQTFWDGRQNAFKEALEVIKGGQDIMEVVLDKPTTKKFQMSDDEVGLAVDGLDELLNVCGEGEAEQINALLTRITLWRDPDSLAQYEGNL
jgi:hypothetical protein